VAFLSPLFLVGALAAGVPILVHLLKREPEVTQRFSAVRLLRAAPIEHASRRHLRELLLLAARVAAILLLALAFARPYLVTPSAAAGTGTVVALDTSASLSAPGQFERARTLARQAVERAPGPVALLTFADTATAVTPLSGDRATVRAAIDAARPGAGATSYRAALERSADLLRGRSGSVVVVTDLQATGWRGGERVALPGSVRVEIADVGPEPPNLSVVAVRPAVGGGVVATVRNSGSRSRSATVSLAVADGGPDARLVPASTTVITVDAGQSADLTLPLAKGRWARVSVEDETGASEDNVRYVVLDGASRLKALVISATGDLNREAFYLLQAILAGSGGVPASGVDGVGGAGLQVWDRTRFAEHAVVVLLSTRGLDHHGRLLISDYLKGGGGMLIGAGPDVDGDVVGEILGRTGFALVQPTGGADGARTLVPVDVRHPVFGGLAPRSSIGLARFRRVTTVRAPGCAMLARFTTGEPAIVECDVVRGRALVFASDLDNRGNDFPRRATFLPFVHEALRYLGDPGRSSDVLVGRTPAGVPGLPGVVALPGVPPRLASVNVDPDESNVGRITEDAFQAAVARVDASPGAAASTATDREGRQPLWRYAVALMIVMLVVESALAARTA
jgi:hypothetical protein